MNIVVAGYGKVGKTLSEQLAREGHDIVVIDINSRLLTDSAGTLDIMCVCGNAASQIVQVEAGVGKADLLIATTDSDELNMLSCLVAKKLGAHNTIARVRNPDYSEQLVFMREELGLSMAINPEQAAANEISRMLRFPAAAKIEMFSQGRIELVELKLTDACPLDGMPLSLLYQKYQVKVLICAVQRGDELFIPSGNFVLQKGDRISVTGTAGRVEQFFRQLGVMRSRARSVMIVGGGRISHYLTKRLLDTGIKVTIIEQNPGVCRELAEELPRANIIEGNGADQELLSEEGIDSVEGFVALTGFDEENIILALYAASRHVGKVIAKVNRSSLADLVSSSTPLDSIISPKDITANRILSYVRAMQTTHGSNVETVYKIVGGKAEAVEFLVKDGSSVLDMPLKSLKLKPNLLIAAITRGNKIIVPGGNDVIQTRDRVLVVTAGTRLHDLDNILA
jgi:trk system potassium uptake protein TrkA